MVMTSRTFLVCLRDDQHDRQQNPGYCFTAKPDFTPYNALKNNIPLDQLNPSLVSLTGDQLYWAEKSLEQNLDDIDLIDEITFNRIIWHATKGYDRPYPEISR
jgi:hypothetical protein